MADDFPLVMTSGFIQANHEFKSSNQNQDSISVIRQIHNLITNPNPKKQNMKTQLRIRIFNPLKRL